MPAKSSDVMSNELHDFVAYTLGRLDTIRLSLQQADFSSGLGQTAQQSSPNPNPATLERQDLLPARSHDPVVEITATDIQRNSAQTSNTFNTLQRIEAIKKRLAIRD